jgi:hypothetical protein
MANREQRGNREKQKPKVDKPKLPAGKTSPFAPPPGIARPQSASAKRGDKKS